MEAPLGHQGYPGFSFITASWKEGGIEEVLRRFDGQILQLSPSLPLIFHMATPTHNGGWEVQSSGYKALVISCLVFAVALMLVSLPSLFPHPIHPPQCCQS